MDIIAHSINGITKFMHPDYISAEMSLDKWKFDLLDGTLSITEIIFFAAIISLVFIGMLYFIDFLKKRINI